MLPITGPYARTSIVGGGDTYYKRIVSYRQKKPYDKRLAFSMETIHKWYPAFGYTGLEGAASASMIDAAFPGYAEAYSKAYSKFKEQVGVTAQLAVDIAERKKSVDMLAKRAMQMVRFTRELRKLDFVKAGRELGLTVKRRKGNRHSMKRDADGTTQEVTLVRDAKSFGNNYLEFHFGWEPLVKGIGESMEVLQSPIFKGLGKNVKGTGSRAHPLLDIVKHVPKWDVYSVYDYRTSVCLRAYVTVDDPNLYKWNALGFLNPATIAWELIPFSFIVDWFANVQQCLSAWSDWIGLSLSEATTTAFHDVGRIGIYRQDWAVWIPVAAYHYIIVKRTLGIAAPTLVLRPPKWPSVTRGLTAISLLTLVLRPK